jgi:hypothetical protein
MAAGDFFGCCKKAKLIWPSSAAAAASKKQFAAFKINFLFGRAEKRQTDPSPPSHFPGALAHSQFANLASQCLKAISARHATTLIPRLKFNFTRSGRKRLHFFCGTNCVWERIKLNSGNEAIPIMFTENKTSDASR